MVTYGVVSLLNNFNKYNSNYNEFRKMNQQFLLGGKNAYFDIIHPPFLKITVNMAIPPTHTRINY